MLEALALKVDGIEEHRHALVNGHVLDAFVAAYTGWLSPDGLDLPPDGYNVASGWIWLPKAAA